MEPERLSGSTDPRAARRRRHRQGVPARDPRLRRDIALKSWMKRAWRDRPGDCFPRRAQRRLSIMQRVPDVRRRHLRAGSWIAMEFVPGDRLDTPIPSHGLPFATVVRLGLEIASALAHAHERGIVHRGLKAGDCVLSTDGTVKVLDFGLATSRGETAVTELTHTSSQPTEAQGPAGTVAYMAPEVLGANPPTHGATSEHSVSCCTRWRAARGRSRPSAWTSRRRCWTLHPEIGPNGDLFVIPASGGTPRRLTGDMRGGRRAGVVARSALDRVLLRPGRRRPLADLEGGRRASPLATGAGHDDTPDFSADGRRMIFTTFATAGDCASAPRRCRRQLLKSAELLYPVFSPDGARIAFFRRQHGRSQSSRSPRRVGCAAADSRPGASITAAMVGRRRRCVFCRTIPVVACGASRRSVDPARRCSRGTGDARSASVQTLRDDDSCARAEVPLV